MRIELYPQKRLVKTNLRRHPAPQRAFLNKYFNKLVDMGFFIPNPNAEWQAANLLVPNNCKAEFRTKIDLRPVKTATIKQHYTIPNIEAKMKDSSKRTCYTLFHFVSGYFQFQVSSDSYNSCVLICPTDTYYSTSKGYFKG